MLKLSPIILSILFFFLKENAANKIMQIDDINLSSVVESYLDPMDVDKLSSFWTEYGFMWDNVGRLCRGGLFIGPLNERNGQGVNTAAWRQAFDVFSQPLIAIQEHRQNGTITPPMIYQSMLGIIKIMKNQKSFLTYSMNSTEPIADSTWSISGIENSIINRTQLSQIIWTRNALFSTMVNTTEQHSRFWVFDDDIQPVESLSRQYSIQVYIKRMKEYEVIIKKQWDKYDLRKKYRKHKNENQDCMCKLAEAYAFRQNNDEQNKDDNTVLDIEWLNLDSFNVTQFTEKQLNITQRVMDIGDGNGFNDIDDNDRTDPSLNIVAWPILLDNQTGTSLASGIRSMMGDYLSLGNGRLGITRAYERLAQWLRVNITDPSERLDRDLDLACLNGSLDAEFDRQERLRNPPNITDDEEDRQRRQEDPEYTDDEISRKEDQERKLEKEDSVSLNGKMFIRTNGTTSSNGRLGLLKTAMLTTLALIAASLTI